MKSLRNIIFTLAVVVGLAFSVSAQNDEQKKPPKQPPVVEPGKKPPRPPKDDKPKKPGMSFFLVSGDRNSNIG